MENSIDKKLLISYISGNATPGQKRQIELWLDSDPEHWDFFYQCLEEWERSKVAVDYDSYTEFIHLTGRIFSAGPSASSLQEQANTGEATSPVKYVKEGQLKKDTTKLPIGLRLNTWQKMAAAAVIIFTFSALILFFYNSGFTTHTACRKIKKVVLPDSSTVILNSYAEIRYASDWDKTEAREVWLEGEAFFSVTHTANHQKFIVHTADHVNVEALGTEFIISRQANRTRVVLNDGKIRVHIQDSSNDSAARQVMMKPGELVELGNSAEQVIKKTVNPNIYSSWKDNRLIFDNSTLPELKMLLEERYKLRVITDDTSLNNIRFNGDFPSEDLQVLLNALAATYDLQVTAASDKVYLKSKSTLNE